MSLVSATHYQGVAAIKSAGNDMMMVVVKASASPADDGQVFVWILFMYFSCYQKRLKA